MNINFWKDDWESDILMDKKWYLFNLFTMIENWYFQLKMSNEVINIIKKTDDELFQMWFSEEDIDKIRKKTSKETLIQKWFNIKDLCILEISRSKKDFISQIMTLIENWKHSEESNYIKTLADCEKIKLWLIMNDLDLIWWSIKKSKKNISVKNNWTNFINRINKPEHSISYDKALNICKYNNTRLPTKNELQKLFETDDVIKKLNLNEKTSIWCQEPDGSLYITWFKNKSFYETNTENKLYLLEVLL